MPDKKELFTAPRWTEIPAVEVTGHVEFTEEEKKQIAIETKKILVEYGVIKETDDLDKIAKKIDYDNLDEYAKESIERTKALTEM